jgi:hypothetical protein
MAEETVRQQILRRLGELKLERNSFIPHWRELTMNHWGQIAAFWLLFEQVLASTSLKSNSTFQLVCNTIDGVIRILTPKPTPEGLKKELTTDTASPN